MKTAIIKLEPHDDFISVKDKMGWSKTRRILLIWPRRDNLLKRKIDLILLQRHSKSLGAQLAIICKNREIRSQANQLAIPVFKNAEQAQKEIWRVHSHFRKIKNLTKFPLISQADKIDQMHRERIQKDNHWLNHPLFRLTFFTIGVIALIAIAFVLLPNAQIILYPKMETREIYLDVKASKDTSEVNITGEIPTISIPILVEGRKTIPASGYTDLPDNFASGEVIFRNLSNQSINIPNGLIVRTISKNPIRFQTIKAGTLLSGTNQTITLPVQALAPGIDSNLPANSLIAIENSIGINLSITNLTPTSGGTVRTSNIPTDIDRQQLLRELSDSLLITAKQELRKSLKKGDQLLSEEPIDTQILKQTFTPQKNIPGDQVELNLNVEYQFMVADEETILSLCQMIANSNLTSDQQSVSDSFEYQNITQPVLKSPGHAEWKIKIQLKILRKINQNRIINQAIGMEPKRLVNHLEKTMPLSKAPIIKMRPSWWPWMPILPTRISVITQPPG